MCACFVPSEIVVETTVEKVGENQESKMDWVLHSPWTDTCNSMLDQMKREWCNLHGRDFDEFIEL